MKASQRVSTLVSGSYLQMPSISRSFNWNSTFKDYLSATDHGVGQSTDSLWVVKQEIVLNMGTSWTTSYPLQIGLSSIQTTSEPDQLDKHTKSWSGHHLANHPTATSSPLPLSYRFCASHVKPQPALAKLGHQSLLVFVHLYAFEKLCYVPAAHCLS